MSVWVVRAVIFVALGLAGAARGQDGNPLAAQGSFAGKFVGDRLSVELADSGGAYAGTFTIAGKPYAAKATAGAEGISGTFAAPGRDYPFTASIAGDQLTVVSAGVSYTLRRAGTGGAAGIGGGSGATGGGGTAMGEFVLLGKTDKGQTLFVKLPPQQGYEATLIETARALVKVLDDKPTLTGAFSDTKDKNAGGATISGKLKGADVKGVILCGGDANQSSANVVLAASDATHAQVQALVDLLPKPLKMTTHAFPDGSGSIDLPDGWNSPTQNAANGIIALGPAGQAVTFGVVQNINDPNGRTARLGQGTYQTAKQMYLRQLQNYNQRRQMGFAGAPPQPPAPPDDPNDAAMKQGSPLRYCAYCDGPEDVLKTYYPLLADLGRRYNKPYTSVDKIMAVVPIAADGGGANMKMGVAYYQVTDHNGDHATQLRVVNQMLTQNNVPGETWSLITSVMRAPEASFDQDFPTMNAIQSSIKLNQSVVGKEFSDMGAAVRDASERAFDTMEKNHATWQDQQEAEFASFEERMAAQRKAREDSASDMIEFAGGLRNVYDSKTGLWTQVDLLNSDGIVGAWNASSDDPHQFIQVPLRYLRQP